MSGTGPTAQSADFGWWPEKVAFTLGDVQITRRPDFDAVVARVLESEEIEGAWIPAPPEGRIFGLAHTHTIAHKAADGPEHLQFLVWALGFFSGMRLSTTPAGYVDATPIRPRVLSDLALLPPDYPASLGFAERFWQANKAEPLRAQRWIAAVHALFISHAPKALQFERFIYLYLALDACFALAKDLLQVKAPSHHHERIGWMCRKFGMPVPAWAKDVKGKTIVSALRNNTFHEALYMGAPLGFKAHGVGTGKNLPLEMQELICRFLIALIGDPDAPYVRHAVTTRMIAGWTPRGTPNAKPENA